MYNEKKFLNIITYAPLFFIPLVMAIIILSSYEVYSQSFDASLKDLKQDLLERKKEAVKNKVTHLSQLIVYQKSRVKKELVNRVKGRVELACQIANAIYNEYKDTKSKEEIKDLITTALKRFQWDDAQSYIWVMNYFGVHYLIENKKDLKGTSYIDFQDAQGRYIKKEEIAICKEKGEGYLWDTFTKPKENNKQYKQIAFVKAFKPYNWCLGSAEFLDTATKKTDKFLFDMINQVDKIGNSYVIIVNHKGDLLVHNKLPQFVGKNITITNKLVVDMIKYLKNVIKDKEYVSGVYDWPHPSTKEMEKKYAYFQKVPGTDWIIGSGFFLSDVENQLTEKKVDMLKVYNTNTQYIFYIAILIILVSLVISFFLSQKIKKRFERYQHKLEEKNKELSELNVSLEEKVKQRTIALENIRDDFERLATTDALTHIHNRYSIMNILSNEISRSSRYDSSLSIIMYDIDYFKLINDTYGHNIGDKVLVSLSSLVNSTMRDVDYIGRYGGEEFLIIMPNTLSKDARIYAERLREIVEDYDFEEIGHMTISIGMVELQKDEDINSVFKRVDDLLYASKNSGRNRVSF